MEKPQESHIGTPIQTLIKEIRIQNFKCFRDFTIKNLNRINIFYGDNDSGKTALLEAIYIAFSNTNPLNVFALLRTFPFGIVEGSLEDSWDLLFYRLNKDKIKIKIVFKDKENLDVELSKPFLYKEVVIQTHELIQAINPHSLYINWKYKDGFREAIINIITPQEVQKFAPNQQKIPPIPVPAPSVLAFGGLHFPLKPVYFFASSGKPSTELITAIYGEIVKEGLKETLIEALREVKPELEYIDTINFAGIPTVAIKFKDDNSYYPLNTVGEGFSKVFTLISLLIRNKDGVLLIDEIENGLYWKIQPIFWHFIETFTEKFNVQLFITTHSYEFLSNIMKSTKNLENINGFTMKRISGNIEHFELHGKDLKEAVEAGFEVR